MDSYSSSFGYKHKYGQLGFENLSKICGKERWEMDALERAECLSDDVTVIAYLMLFIFYVVLFSTMEVRR
jgi:hypothetical protein